MLSWRPKENTHTRSARSSPTLCHSRVTSKVNSRAQRTRDERGEKNSRFHGEIDIEQVLSEKAFSKCCLGNWNILRKYIYFQAMLRNGLDTWKK